MATVRAARVISKFTPRKYPSLSGHAGRNLSVSSSLAARTHISSELKDDVAVIRFNDPKATANTLCRHTMSEILDVLREIWSNGAVNSAVFISSKPGCFIAGADIKVIQSLRGSEEGRRLSREFQTTFEMMEKSPIPIVAAIHGACLGGGLEAAMACHYRIATKSKKTILGLPEVTMGLLPAIGGTQRLPKMVGLPGALDMMLTGRSIKADKAKEMGLVQQLVDPLGPAEERTIEHLEEVAVGVARGIAKKQVPLKLQHTVMSLCLVKNNILEAASRKVQAQARGLYPAPVKILEVSNSPHLK
ncbi:hydroxyacyl-CoA dehydrogenase trifunctional multienzyme complex subunit alpha a [Centropristis striata]|uniref:hydroxyacyl-CoA dehydrogenase trifunctional multienzyme complex subunit alpha a n=1 Tax=Centropristis striata TaxID=184440 RepID=UPI0027E216B2|nr:hydroxyacyl-CoA dehydrogenase trifunctional multienzyme complex subunit alpha a [Centropristis striata]